MSLAIHPYNYCRMVSGFLRGILAEMKNLLENSENIPGLLYEKIGGGNEFLTLEEKVRRAEKGLPPEEVKDLYYRVKPTARIYKIVAEAADKLGEVMPAVYVKKVNDLNASCHINHHSISFCRTMLEDFNDDELKAIAGHELKHFKHDHFARKFKWKLSDLMPSNLNLAAGWLGFEVYKHGVHVSDKQMLHDLSGSLPLAAATSIIALCTIGLVAARHHYNEYDADKAAVKVAGALASSSAMSKIKTYEDKFREKDLSWVEKTKGKTHRAISEIKQNLIDDKIGSRTHPPTRKRIDAILNGQVPDILHREL